MPKFTPLYRYALLVLSLLFSLNAISQITAYPYSENFEAGIGLWNQDGGDVGDWERQAEENDGNSTPSGSTGPSLSSDNVWGGADGFFLFTESSNTTGSNVGFNGTAFLSSPEFDLTGQFGPNFNFSYHMFGGSMGRLSIDISTNNGVTYPTTLWTRNGQQHASHGAAWSTATIDLSAYIGQTIKLRIRGNTGNSWQSDMAVDNVSLTTTTPQPEINVTGLGNTITDGDITPVATDNTDFGDFNIPSAAVVHTFTIQNTGTADLDLTGGPLVQIGGAASGDYTVTALPTSPVAAGGSTTFSISFTASVAGARNATVTIVNNDSTENPYNFNITGNGIVPPPCSATITTYPYAESFETGFGFWNQVGGDNGDWLRQGQGIAPGLASFQTPSAGTGPDSAAAGLRYIYTEATNGGTAPGNSYRITYLESPCFNLTSLANPEFRFQYHMFGSNMGTLRVQISTNNGITYTNNDYSVGGQQQTNISDPWRSATVDLGAFAGQTVKIRLFGMTGNGFESDLALDDFSLVNAIAESNAPGGVVSNLQLWLKSTDGLSYTDGQPVSTWQTQAKGSDATVNTAGQEPTYYDNPIQNINFNPVVSFQGNTPNAGQNIDLTVGGQQFLMGDSGFFSNDMFIVYLPDDPINSTYGAVDLFIGDANELVVSGALSNIGVDVTGIGLGASTERFTNEVINYSIGGSNGSGPMNDMAPFAGYGSGQIDAGVTYDNVSLINTFTNSSNSNQELFYNGLNIGNQVNDPADFSLINNSRYFIGRSQAYEGSYNGRIAEIVTYATKKNDADATQERNRIQSYLAIKYGITLGVNGVSQDYVDSDGTVIWDQSANAGFNYNITGIGRDDASELDQRQSLSINNAVDGSGPIEGLLTMGLTELYDTNNLNKAATTGFGDKQFLTWGDNDGNLNLSNTINVDLSSGIAGLTTPVTFESTQRIWKVVENGGDVPEVKIRVPISALRGVTPPGDFYMFVSNAPMFDPTANYTVMRPSLSDPTVLEGNYDFDGTKFITFGYAEEITRIRSINFDGSTDYVEMGDVLNLNPAGFTISAWIKRDAGSNGRTIVSKRNIGYTSGYEMRIEGSGFAEMRWRVGGSNRRVTSTTAIPVNEWHHITATYDGSRARIYIDGVLDNTANLPAPSSTTDNFNIAASGKGAPTAFFPGNIDEIRIWDTDLSENQLRYIMNQEIEDNAGFTNGMIIPSTITLNEIAPIPWTQLAGYYPMTRYTYTNTKDESGNNNIGALRNLNTVDFQTAPLPYESENDGTWLTDATWLNNTVQTLPNALSIVDGTTPIDWNIVRTSHNIRINTDAVLGRQRSVLGLFVDSNTLTINGSTPVGTGNALNVSHYLKIDGKLDLNGESQLIQTTNSDFDVTSSGTLERDQQGTQDLYTYNYWSSPVGISNVTSNNNSYALPDIFFDGTTSTSPQAINYLTSGFDGTNGSPIGLADYWIWKFNNRTGDTYSEWQHVRSTGTLLAGEGFTLKGVDNTGGIVSNEQNYVFEGKPNNGDITLSINSGNDYLVGNPYPSAIDAVQFITDNGTSTTGTLYFWEHWGGGSHILGEYQGGYATYNLSGGLQASGNDPDVGTGGTPTKTPGQFIPVAQGFFVTSGSTGNVEFNNGQRIYTKEGGTSIFVRNGDSTQTESSNRSDDTRMKLRLGFNSINGLHRQLLVTEDSRATPGIDWGFDGQLNEDQIDDMYWMLDNQKFVIQGTNTINRYTVLPLGLHTKDSGDNTFTIDNLENVPSDLEIYLHDKETGLYHDLRAGDFTINLLSGEYYTRFEITFTNNNTLNTTEVDFDTNIEFYYSNTNESIVISNPSLETLESVGLYNIIGQSIIKFDDVETIDYSEIKLKSISSGNYILKLKTEAGIISKKVLID